jgi:hypothetical protein
MSVLLINTFLEVCSLACVGPFVDKMTVITVDPKERARIQSILSVGVIIFSSPFGWIAGTLSGFNKDLPFILNIVLFAIGAGLAYMAGKASQRQAVQESLIE